MQTSFLFKRYEIDTGWSIQHNYDIYHIIQENLLRMKRFENSSEK